MCVCASGGSLSGVHSLYASVYGSVCVCVCVFDCVVSVSLLGSHWTDPQPLLNTETASPALFFFFFFSNMLPASLSSHEIGPSLARSDCLHCKWLLWSLPRGRRGPIQGQKRYKRRLTDPTLPPCPCSPSEPHQQVLLLVYAQVKSNPSQLMRTITMTYKINILLDCSVLFTLSYHPPLPGLLCRQWWCGAMTPVL